MDIHTEHIIAYLEGKLSIEERIAFDQQMQSSPDFKKEVDDIRFIWETTAELKLHKQINTQQNWKKISKQIATDKYKKKILSFIRTAAAVLLIPVLFATYTLFNTVREWNNIPVEQVELNTAYGLISKITLPDGSEVWLNSGSSISYPKRFTKNKRSVQLAGEAYFKVTSDKSNRFDVTTANGLQVSAFGTEFNVKAYEDEDKIEATLAKGHIEVSEIGQPVSRTLRPGEQVTYYKNTSKMEVDKVNLAVETSWKDGKMIFRRANMNEVVQRLARHFNVDIKLEGEELYDYKYSATFTTETLHEVLLLLEKTAPIKCTVIEPEQTSDFTYSRRIVIIKTVK
ncbi:FecR domain-containing protein [Parabacteroides sp.]|uniref:FecR family protein n=1 Tax=Parabacteroides sp. TaxID=1869337 RepID=UPI0030805762